jgi:integrase
MAAKSRAAGQQRGRIETLPSGSLRVKVYAGVDPLTGRRHDLTETIPAGPKAEREAQKSLTRLLNQLDEKRLLNQLDEKRNPRTRATVDQLMDRYFQVLQVESTTRVTYEGYVRNHIRPLLGDLALSRLDGELLDSFYAELRRCHCPKLKPIGPLLVGSATRC